MERLLTSDGAADFLLDINRQFLLLAGFEALRPEAKLLITLQQRKSMPVKDAMACTGLSYRGFYIMLQRLLKSETVVLDVDARDKRVRRLRLREQVSFGDAAR